MAKRLYNNCVLCARNNKKDKACNDCDGTTKFDELYDADPDCKHNVVSSSGGGVHCTKCTGWFCF